MAYPDRGGRARCPPPAGSPSAAALSPRLEPLPIAAERTPLRALVANERMQRVGPARGVLIARDAAHLMAHQRHARGGRERLIPPVDPLQPRGRLAPRPPAVRQVWRDRDRACKADWSDPTRAFIFRRRSR